MRLYSIYFFVLNKILMMELRKCNLKKNKIKKWYIYKTIKEKSYISKILTQTTHFN